MFQQVMLIGNLGSDPEMRYTSSGVPVTSFSLAVNKKWTTQEGQKQEKTTWFRISAWRKEAELAAQYLTKGRQVMVIGEIDEPRIFTGRDGQMHTSLEVTATMIRFLGGGRGEGVGGAAESGASHAAAPANAGSEPHISDEDIPF